MCIRDSTKIAQTDFLALKQHLTHAVYVNVEDGADAVSYTHLDVYKRQLLKDSKL